MKITINKSNLSDLMTLSSLHIFVVFSILSTSAYFIYFSNILKFIVLLCVLIALFSEILKKYTIKNLIGVFSISILFIIVNNNSNGIGQLLFPASFIFIYCLRDYSYDKLARQLLILTSFVLFFVIVSSQIGIIPNYVRFEARRTRYFVGFLYALFAPSYMSNIILLNLYLKKREISIFNIFILVLSNIWIFQQTGSRLTFYSSLATIVFGLLYKYFPNMFRRRLIFWPLVCSFLFFAIISYYFAVNYDYSIHWHSSLNQMLGHRLRLGHESFLNYSFKFFGQPLSWQGHGLNAFGVLTTTSQNYNYVDNLYIIMLQRYGLLFVMVFVSAVTVLLQKIYKKGDIYLLFIFLNLGFHALLDDTILYLHYNSFWLIFATFLTKNYRLGSESIYNS